MEPVKKLIKQATTQIEREREQFSKTLGITGVQMSTIDFLSNNENNSADQHAIEREFGIQRSTTTVMLQRMEKRGLIKRISDPVDKRRKKVQLTDKSLMIVPKIKEFMKKDDLELTSHFSEKEIEDAKRIIRFVKNGGKNE